MTFVRVALFTFFTGNLVVFGDPTLMTTSSPNCTDYKYYSNETALEVCQPDLWGATDRGYGTMLACNATLQNRLEESYANELFDTCNSWCIYDLMDRAESGYIWRSPTRDKDPKNCWEEETKYFCFEQKIEDKEKMANKSLTICPKPTFQPTLVPTTAPTFQPTLVPTTAPTFQPTLLPTTAPTFQPTLVPTTAPTFQPTLVPTWAPTKPPSTMPTVGPTIRPSNNPTYLPSNLPTRRPTHVPTKIPTRYPTDFPSIPPTSDPTNNPTNSPTEEPTSQPTTSPTYTPSRSPTEHPSMSPSPSPTGMPTMQPTSAPTSLSPTLSPTTLYTHYVMCTINTVIDSTNLDHLSYLAVAIGKVLSLREPENEVITLQTTVLSYERRRLLQSSTDFEIMTENQDIATTVAVTIQTNLFIDAVIEEFNNASGFTLEALSVDVVSGPHCYRCASATDNTPIIIIACASGGVAALLCYYIFYRFKKKVKRRYIQKTVTQMFSEAPPGSYRWESDLPAIMQPSEKEIEHLFEDEYMDMECQIEGYSTTIGSSEHTGRGITEGGTRTVREGHNNLRVLQLNELTRQTPNGDSSVSESESDSSNESPDEPYSLSPSQKKTPADFVNFMHIPVDDIIERVTVSPDLMDRVNHKPKRSTERRKW